MLLVQLFGGQISNKDTNEVIVNNNDKKNFSQNHYDFLRTDNDYKLIFCNN